MKIQTINGRFATCIVKMAVLSHMVSSTLLTLGGLSHNQSMIQWHRSQSSEIAIHQLNDSLRNFPEGEEICNLMFKSGFFFPNLLS